MTSQFLFLIGGYFATVLIELPILWFGLDPRHDGREKCFAGFWLTACTYPIVVLVLPQWISVGHERMAYLAIGETFAASAECFLFLLIADGARGTRMRDCAAIIGANLASLLAGESVYWIMTR